MGGFARILAPMNQETSLWKASSSQWLNLGNYTAALVVAIGIGIGGLFFPPVFAARRAAKRSETLASGLSSITTR